jgi:hypothetical protein
MTDLNRMRKLAGMNEHAEVDDDAALDAYEAQEAREEKVKNLIKTIFERTGLAFTKLTYDEHPERIAVVVLDDQPLGWSLNKLNRLKASTLADDYQVVAYNGIIEIHFKVKAEVDWHLN